MRTPLRYPGGKSLAIKQLRAYMPQGLSVLASPFLGGGSLEVACAVAGIRVFGYDLYWPLVNFWRCVLSDPVFLERLVRGYYPLARARFYALRDGYEHAGIGFESAAIFYVLNRASYSGLTLSGGMSLGHPRFTESSMRSLAAFRAPLLDVASLGFEASLARHASDFLYVDPPYATGEALYGRRGSMHVGFAHAALADILCTRRGWLLSYNDCNWVRKRYAGYDIYQAHWYRSMSANREVLISCP